MGSFAFGLGLYTSGAYWIWVSMVDVAATPMAIAAVLELLFIGGLAGVMAGLGWIYRSMRGPEWLIFPALVVFGEGVRTYLFTGFPWLFAGYAAVDSPWAPWASVIGVYGFSALLGLLAVSLLKPRALLASLPLILGMTLIQPPLPTATGDTVSVRLVQGAIPANRKWDPDWRERIVERHINPTLTSDADWIIWSENAVPLLGAEAEQFFHTLDQLLPDQALLAGRLIEGPTDRSRRYYNALSGHGLAMGAQFKTRLVPFGEYVPLENWLRGVIDFFDLPLSVVIPGDSPQPLTIGATPVAGLICYEIAYPALAWSRTADTRAIITVSNDAWFGDSIARDQHFQMARMRAIESGQPVIRATNDGITAVIDSRGQVTARLDDFAPGVLDAR